MKSFPNDTHLEFILCRSKPRTSSLPRTLPSHHCTSVTELRLRCARGWWILPIDIPAKVSFQAMVLSLMFSKKYRMSSWGWQANSFINNPLDTCKMLLLRFGRGRRKFNLLDSGWSHSGLGHYLRDNGNVFLKRKQEAGLLVSTEGCLSSEILGQWAAQVSLTSSASEGTCLGASNKCSPYVGGWAEPQCWLLRRRWVPRSGSVYMKEANGPREASYFDSNFIFF